MTNSGFDLNQATPTMAVLIINGAPRAGKDTFITAVNSRYGCVNYSSVTWIKDIAKQMGWDGGKTPADRKFLAQLKDISTQYNNRPFDKVIEKIQEIKEEGKTQFFCVCIREPKEIVNLLYWCNIHNIPAYSIYVRNCEAEQTAYATAEHTADTEFHKFHYEYQIYNNGSLNDFLESIPGFVDTILWDISIREKEKK